MEKIAIKPLHPINQNPFSDPFEQIEVFTCLRNRDIERLKHSLESGHNVLCMGPKTEFLYSLGIEVEEKANKPPVTIDLGATTSWREIVREMFHFAADAVGHNGVEEILSRLATSVTYTFDAEAESFEIHLPRTIDRADSINDVLQILRETSQMQGGLLVTIAGGEALEDVLGVDANCFIQRLISTQGVICLMLINDDTLRRDVWSKKWLKEGFFTEFYEVNRVAERELYDNLVKSFEKVVKKDAAESLVKQLLATTHGFWEPTFSLAEVLWDELALTVERENLLNEPLEKLTSQQAVYQPLWRGLSVNERYVLERITRNEALDAQQDVEPSRLESAIQRLAQLGFISKVDDHQYRIVDPVFAYWLKGYLSQKSILWSEIPNWVTVQAIEEANEMIRTGKGKTYTVEELFKELYEDVV